MPDFIFWKMNHLYINLAKWAVSKNMEHLQYCSSLKIRIRANNFITNIDSLVCRPHPLELGLHGNQEGNAEKTLSCVKDVVSKINRVLAPHSPIIIQGCPNESCNRWIYLEKLQSVSIGHRTYNVEYH
uniref:Uncharacterized protein n=1 Tax=Nothoprocta perdicaria TaxID=30464 RepID=A0A8C6YQK1_NOTPE